MRAAQFIVEYSQTKTAQVFGRKLITALEKDNSINRVNASLYQSKIYLDQKKKIGGEIHSDVISTAIGKLLIEIEKADPTPHKQYTAWLCKVYSNEGIKLEDLTSKGADWLATYNELKKHKLLTPDINDINKLTFQGLYQIISDPSINGELANAKQAAMPKGESLTLRDNTEVRIIWPKDMLAAKYYGQGTQWCTAATNNNMFDQYNRSGPLFILLPKKPKYVGEKYQVHFASGSFMDETDEPVDSSDLVYRRFGDLLGLFKMYDPNIRKIIEFMDDDILIPTLKSIRDSVYEYVFDLETTWQENDDYYTEWLRSEGYVDETGDIDWDRAPSYLEYDDDAKRLYNGLIDAVSTNPKQVKEWAISYGQEMGDSPKLEKLDQVIAWGIGSDMRGRGYDSDVYENLASWIEKNVKVDTYGKVSLMRYR